MAEISVIIPVYNAEKYIAGCLDALCAQTFGDIEVLCVDDGSTDGSGSILAEYAGKARREPISCSELVIGMKWGRRPPAISG
mgnify:CR=1 FL=1